MQELQYSATFCCRLEVDSSLNAELVLPKSIICSGCLVNPRIGVCVLHTPQETVLHSGDAHSLYNEPPVYILTSTPTTVNRN